MIINNIVLCTHLRVDGTVEVEYECECKRSVCGRRPSRKLNKEPTTQPRLKFDDPTMLLFFSTVLAALPLLFSLPFIYGCCIKKKKKKGPLKPKPPQGVKPGAKQGMPPVQKPGMPPVQQPGMPPTQQPGMPPAQRPMTMQPGQPQLISLPTPPGQQGTPTIFLMQPSTQPGGQPTFIPMQLPAALASTIQPPAASMATAPAKPTEAKPAAAPATPDKDEKAPDTKEEGTKEDLYEDITTAIIKDDKKDGSGSKRATTESKRGSNKTPDKQPVEVQEIAQEGMADPGQYQTLADLNVDAMFTKK